MSSLIYKPSNTRFNHDKEQGQFMAAALSLFPKNWADTVQLMHSKEVKKSGAKKANERILSAVELLPHNLNIAASDDEINALGKELALEVSGFMQDKPLNMFSPVLVKFEALCKEYGVKYPNELEPLQILARGICPVWWLRVLRVAHNKAREGAAIEAGIVHKKSMAYASDDTVINRRQQLRRNAAILDDVTLRSESGQEMKLSDIAKAGISNPDNRRAELMTRLSGFEELGNKYNHKAEFVTITCPSRMHAVHATGEHNKKYDGTKPDQAQAYLVKVWSQARAWLHRNDVKVYGLRVAEPHHDATPHWHMVLWYDGKKSTLKKLRWCLAHYFCMDSREELYNDISPRVKFKRIDGRGACGYVVKYVSKNIGGLDGEEDTETGGDSIEGYERVEAWASTWRIRQFQQIGGHSVTVWRELRRVDESEARRVPRVFEAWQHAQKVGDKKANFAKYIEAVGGLNTKPRESWICLEVDYITKRGRYGEALHALMAGVRERFGFGISKNNREKWERVK